LTFAPINGTLHRASRAGWKKACRRAGRR
jgi:hypothetical protein